MVPGRADSADTAWAFTLGLLVGTLWVGALVHMLVAFPSGRVQPGLERRLVVVGWSAAIVLPLLAALVTARPNDCGDCPDNLLLVWDSDAASTRVEGIGLVVGVVLLAGLGVVLLRRWRGFGKVQRRALAPVVWTGAAVVVVGVLSVLPIALGADEVAHAVDAVLIVLITALPFAFLVGLMRSSLSRAGAVSALFERLGGVSARDALAEALGDDSLALAYWLPDSGRYVDARGHTVELPAPGGGRAVTEIERDGRRSRRSCTTRRCSRTASWCARRAPRRRSRSRTSGSPPSCARATTTCARRARGWSPPATRRAAGSSATCTTAHSSASSRSRSRSTSRAGTRSPARGPPRCSMSAMAELTAGL